MTIFRRLYGFSSIVALAAGLTLLSCGGSSRTSAPAAIPVITSFTAAKSPITTGTATTLTAVFDGGTGSVDQGLGAVTSGAAKSTGNLTATTTFKLTVAASGGSAVQIATVQVVPAPDATITAPATVIVAQAGNLASVPDQVGSTYAWTITGGTLTAGATTRQAAFTASAAGTLALHCTVTNAAGTSASADASVAAVMGPVSILVPPFSQAVTAPDGALFSVVAGGSGPYSYQWKKNGAAIPGATAAAYRTDSTDLRMNPDSYSVVVSNSISSIESAPVSFVVVAPNPYYLPGGQPVPVPSRPLTILPSLHSDAVRFPNGAFRFGYDEALKNPAWTAYANFKISSNFPNSTGDYQTDTRLLAPQVTPAAMGTHGNMFYLANGQGFDRGHMVPRADLSYRYGQAAGDDATYMSDMVSQVSYFNQRLWNDFEEAIGGKFTNNVFDNGVTATFGRVWIYTGPVFTGATDYWVPSTETYTKTPGTLPPGTLAIAIPTACYRVIVAEPASGQTLPRVIAWVAFNRSYATGETADIWKYSTSVKRVEELTGLDFFPGLPHDATLSAWKAALDVRGWGANFEKATGPNVHVVKPSWDLLPITTNPVLKGEKVNIGDPVAFEGAVSPNAAGGTVNGAAATWTFGDNSATTTGLTTTHVYTNPGSYTVTFSATDSLGKSNAITRVVTVVDPTNAPPVFTPDSLPDASTTTGTAKVVTFAVADDQTVSGAIVVAATSGNQSLLKDAGIAVANANGAITLTLTPEAGQNGTALVTVTATDGKSASTVRTFTLTVSAALGHTLLETFEAGVKTAYAAADVAFTNGTWNLSDALVGTTSGSDRFNGAKAIRMRNGTMTMKFDFPYGAQTVTVQHAKYGNDANGAWGLWVSTDQGGSWTPVGSPVTTTTTTLTPAVFNVNLSVPVRFEIRKTDGLTNTRVCFDDFQISGN